MKKEQINPNFSRRQFLKFMGATSAYAAFVSTGLLAACSTVSNVASKIKSKISFTPLLPSSKDEFKMADNFEWKTLISWGDDLGNNLKFGYNNDYIAFLPEGKNSAFMWVNNESVTPFYVSGWLKGTKKTKEQIVSERKAVGGSFFRISRNDETSPWVLDSNKSNNYRLDGFSKIPFSQNALIQNSKFAVGTLGNCAGGVTPWKTILTCEENYHDYFGEAHMINKKRSYSNNDNYYNWNLYEEVFPEHYGWVVEFNPKTHEAKKHIALGRFAHEGATVRKTNDGRVVVYMGDDAVNECIYKFIARDKNSIEYGDLYAANTEKGEWVHLDWATQPLLQKHFNNQIEVLTYTREAAHLLGATAQDRPEDIEIHPKTGDVYISLTNNKTRKNPYGALFKLVETNNDPLSLTFTSSIFISGGPESGFACPDNLVFDKAGNLWMTCDIAEEVIEIGPYKGFGNNSLFYIPLTGEGAGEAFRVANGPIDSELTGPCFSSDYSTLFVSVQHPGQRVQHMNGVATSHWPLGGNHNPKPTVVQINGPALAQLMNR